jgi:metallo-beta-lactamase family protein
VKIFDYLLDVNAGVESIHSLSAHGDYNDMIRYLSCQQKSLVKKLFLVHGEAKTKSVFREKLLQEGFNDIVIPARGEIIELG